MLIIKNEIAFQHFSNKQKVQKTNFLLHNLTSSVNVKQVLKVNLPKISSFSKKMLNSVITNKNKNGYVSHFTNSKNFLAAIIFLVISKIGCTAFMLLLVNKKLDNLF